ncbi:TetR-like C-terminal domain-containing protein [Naumannella huperziae]
MSYHHGDLRQAFLAAAARAIEADGVDSLNLRALARELGVTHTAPRHHFGDRRGVLTALASQGHDLLTGQLAKHERLIDSGVAYVLFAVAHPAHFRVMFAPELLDNDDPTLGAARDRLADELTRGAGQPRGASPSGDPALLAPWGLAHGIATLAVAGNLGPTDTPAFRKLVRATLGRLATTSQA